ncbi:MAG: ABC transporter permease [Gammaproteobacteria bacterium]|nr:ABC transporter permease [Gammaproteobacteria bacterium]
MRTLPTWYTAFVIPIVQLIAALAISSLVVLMVGENPFKALGILVNGAVNLQYGLSSTLYYATNFIFTGLAVAVAFHGGLFNIGGEGQAYFAGIAVAAACVALDAVLPAPLMALVAIVAAIVGGAIWAFIPGWLQAKRGSHLVVTTIMFNFIAFSVVNLLLMSYFTDPKTLAVESRYFADDAILPMAHELFRSWGFKMPKSLLNTAFIVALITAALVWWLLWRTKLGYAIRAVGQNPRAADYAGIGRSRVIIITVLISGGLAGLMAFNEVYGAQHRMVLAFTNGFGFIGIAVALMGRNHPFGVVLAALVFGGLYQGGTDLQFDMPSLSRELILVIQGLVIYFTSATDQLLRSPLEKLYLRLAPKEA